MKRLLATAIVSAFVWACSDGKSDTAGATSETTNGIAIRVTDGNNQPMPQARVSLYSKADLVKLNSATTDELGMAYLQEPAEECYLEGIAGADSSFMVWNEFGASDSVVALSQSASVVVRIDSADAANLKMKLAGTPYKALYQDSAFVFAHVPAGVFDLMVDDSIVATINLSAGMSVDTALYRGEPADDFVGVQPDSTFDRPDSSVALPDTSAAEPDTIQLDNAGIFTFEDFEDGDSLNNLAKYYPNYGWYFTAIGDGRWILPGNKDSFAAVLDSSAEQGRYLSARFDVGDSGMVILGSHLGADSGFFDLSGLSAVRVTYRSDCNFSIALEHSEEVAENTFNKALWKVEASEEWTEAVLKPGNEIVAPQIQQQEWGDVSKKIALFSLFIQKGSFIEIDRIVFEGVNFVYYAP